MRRQVQDVLRNCSQKAAGTEQDKNGAKSEALECRQAFTAAHGEASRLTLPVTLFLFQSDGLIHQGPGTGWGQRPRISSLLQLPRNRLLEGSM